ncbi:MAG: DUF3772 domain-containing protein [Pseudomonadota bacterium]
MLISLFRLISLVLAFAVGLAHAQTEGIAPLADEISTRAERLAAIEATIAEGTTATELLTLRDELRTLRRDEEAISTRLVDERKRVQQLIEQLGEAPAEGVEGPILAQQRRELNASYAQLADAAVQSADNLSLSVRLAERIASQRRDAFTGQLFARGPILLSAEPWRVASRTLVDDWAAARAGVGGWLRNDVFPQDRVGSRIALIAAVGAAIAAIIFLRREIQRRLTRVTDHWEPLPSRRVLVAGIRTVVFIVFGLIAAFCLYEALRSQNALPTDAGSFIRAMWLGLAILLFAQGAAQGFLAPDEPRWRVTNLDTGRVLVIRALTLGAATTLVTDLFIRRGAELLGDSPSLAFVQKGISAIVLAVILLLIARSSLWRTAASPDPEPAEDPDTADASEAPENALKPKTDLWVLLRRAARFASGLSIVAALAGFVEFAHFIMVRSFIFLALITCFLFLRAALREGVRFIDARFSSESVSGESGDVEANDERLLFYWTGVIIDVLAFLIFVPPVLVLSGAAWGDVRGWVLDAVFGFRIGQFDVSIAKFIAAGATVAALLWLTGLVRKGLENSVFPKSRLDEGVQNSLKTLVGYVGLIVAVAAGVGALGVDLSSLAIIAGALSVGIGFGLQSIVNNFVSGLILLFERPIKVGDWIVTASGEGIVKKISVRSTEIETFDRSSIIVPNGELISSSVTNWTHKNKTGRVVVAVGASYNSKAEHVISVLQDIANTSPDLLPFPAPTVVFENFGDSSLDFSVRGFVKDVGTSLGARTRLRVAIHDRFREEGIEIPFPQRDLHVVDWPGDSERETDRQVTNGEDPAPLKTVTS